MSEVDGDVDFRDGKIYAYTATNLTRVSDNTLIYRCAATGTPTSEDNTLQVSTANNVPKLDWRNEINYSADGFEPDSGMAGSDFTFRVQYTDLENVAPASIKLWVDLNDDLLEDGYELITMTAVDFSYTTYDDGKLYTATVVIPAQDDPKATYHFNASDSIDAAIGNATANQTAINNVNVGDGDYILVKDGIYNSAINYNGKNLYIVSESGAAATTLANNGNGYSFDNPVVKLSNGESGGDPSFIRRSTADMYTPKIDGDYHLSSTSNCIDTADDTHKPARDDDIEGSIRPLDISGKGNGLNDYDKGAYEYRN